MNSLARFFIAIAFVAVVDFSVASAAPIGFVHYAHTPPRPPAPTHRITIGDVMRARAGGWQQVSARPLFGPIGASTPILMTDGTVMVHDGEWSWYSLTPDQNGDYQKGTWTLKNFLPAGYAPLYYGSSVLADGKLVINGGEYNFFQGPLEINLGAIYDPVTNRWARVSPPSGWSEIGDASSVVLSDGTYMLGNCCFSSQALLSEGPMTWSVTGAGKADPNSEEGWTLLPSGKVLTADVFNEPNSELYDPSTGSWSSAGPIPVNLIQGSEIGPQLLRPDGTVFVAGASQHTAIYNTHTGKWAAGPDFPVVGGLQLDVADGPSTLLPNGNVLVAASPGVYHAPTSMLIFDGTKFTTITGPPNEPNVPSFAVRLLVLPTGQVLETDSSDDVEIYTPNVAPYPNIAPTISSVPTTLTHGNTYKISGKRFNGVSQANAYGDDVQSATNFPLLRITNNMTGHVFYARTHNHSFMGVASQATVSTMFDVPSTIELGASKLEVVANGIHSHPVGVTIN